MYSPLHNAVQTKIISARSIQKTLKISRRMSPSRLPVLMRIPLLLWDAIYSLKFKTFAYVIESLIIFRYGIVMIFALFVYRMCVNWFWHIYEMHSVSFLNGVWQHHLRAFFMAVQNRSKDRYFVRTKLSAIIRNDLVLTESCFGQWIKHSDCYLQFLDH